MATSQTILTTLGGHRVDYLKPSNICLEDIALSLSRQPRWAGQTARHYSVAQHCLLVRAIAPYCGIYALLHDAPEAFLCDIPTPAKEAMRRLSGGRSPYDELEERLYAAICARLEIDPLRLESVHLADVASRKIEMRAVRRGAKTRFDSIFDLQDGGRAEWLDAVLSAKQRIVNYSKAVERKRNEL